MKSIPLGKALVRLVAGLFAAGLYPRALAAPKVAMEHVVLHRDDTLYYLGPSLAVLPSGEILMGLREAHARPPRLSGHVDPTARSVLLRSRDGGRTFGEKRVVDDETFRFSSSQDTTLTVLGDGSLVASLYSWGIAQAPSRADRPKSSSGMPIAGADKPFSGIFEGAWTRRSTDGGTTWTERRAVQVKGLPPLATRAPMIELDDGTLLLQVNDFSRGIDGARDWARVFCLRSKDRGATWGEPALVAEGADRQVHFLEPSLVRLRSGRMITMLRTRGEGAGADERKGNVGSHFGYLFQSVSEDRGRTWARPEPTPMWGFPGHVLELRDGRLLCAYGYRRAPYGVRATLSHDGGKTWDIAHEIVVRSDGGTVDLGYPVSIQLPDGRILMAYYFNQERKGEAETTTRYIAGTFLKL